MRQWTITQWELFSALMKQHKRLANLDNEAISPEERAHLWNLIYNQKHMIMEGETRMLLHKKICDHAMTAGETDATD